MSTTAVPPTPTPVATEFSGAHGANFKPAKPDETQNSELKKPDLLHPTDIEVIKSKVGDDFKKWKLLYSQAYNHQQELKKRWKDYREENLKKPNLEDDESIYNSPNLKVLQDNHAKYSELVASNFKGLAEVNGKIQAMNKESGKLDEFGKAALPVMCPNLVTPGDWDTIRTKLMSNQDALLKISKYFSLGYSLQKIFNFGIQALDDNFTEEYVKAIAKAIIDLNSSIRALKLNKKNKNLGRILTPTSMDSSVFILAKSTMPGDQSDSDDDDDDGSDNSGDENASVSSVGENVDGPDIEMGDGERPEIPATVMKVLTSMGGDGGVLQRVLLSMDDHYQIPDKALAAEFDSSQDMIRQLTLEAKVDSTGTVFQINLGQLKQVISTTVQASTALLNDLGNRSLQQDYDRLRKEVVASIAELKYPKNFEDALAPSHQSQIDDFYIEKFKPELERLIELLGGQDGCLSRYLHSKAVGETDDNAKKEVEAIRESIHTLLGSENLYLLDGPLSGYSFSAENLELLFEHVEKLKGEEKRCAADPSRNNIYAMTQKIEATKNTLGHKVLCEAVIGDIETSGRFRGKPEGKSQQKPLKLSKLTTKKIGSDKPFKLSFKSPKKTHGQKIIIDDNDSDIILTHDFNPNVVTDVVDNRRVEKKIVGYKEITKRVNVGIPGRETLAVVGYQLLLSWREKRKPYPSFEMVPGHRYPGGAQEFAKNGGAELEIGTVEDLHGVPFTDLKCVGLCPVGSPHTGKEINQSQRLMLRMYRKSSKKKQFFYISTLRSKYGTRADNWRRDCAEEMGMTLEVAEARKDEREKKDKERANKDAEIENLKNQLINMALGLPPPKIKPIKEISLLSRRQIGKIDRKGLAVELSSDSGDDVDSNGDSSEDEGSDDDQDLKGFVVSDKGYSEEVANKNSELLALKDELDRLKEKERSIKQKIKSTGSEEKRSKGKKKLKKLLVQIQGTGEAITAVMKELASLKENEDNNSSLDSSDSSSDFSDSSNGDSSNGDSSDEGDEGDEGNSGKITSKTEELQFLKQDLDRLRTKERSMKQQVKQSASEKERKKTKKKLEGLQGNIKETREAIKAVTDELSQLKQNEVSSSDEWSHGDDNEATQLRVDIENARKRGQMHKVKALERRLKGMR